MDQQIGNGESGVTAAAGAPIAAFAGYSHVGYFVRDLAAARHFYGELLGLPELPRPAFRVDGVWYRVGALQLHLGVWPDCPPPPVEPSLGVGPHIALHTPDFAATVAALERKGMTFTLPPFQSPRDGAWRAFCSDPDGNTIEITDQGPLL